MQNIDPIFILQPVIIIIICSALLVYWFVKRRFHLMVLVYTLVAYFVAIALKYAVQIPTYGLVSNYFGIHSVGIGVYYGLQTVVFEVGLAYIVAWFVASRGLVGKKDVEAYGSGLAFWENAVFLGVLSLINLVTYYLILGGNTPLAQTVYDQLSTNAPGLFAPASQAWISISIGTFERISSIIIHFAWGYLCLMAAVMNKKRLFLIALPMGFIDFLVPFALTLGDIVFEVLVFALSVVSLAVALYAVRQVGKKKEQENQAANTRVDATI